MVKTLREFVGILTSATKFLATDTSETMEVTLDEATLHEFKVELEEIQKVFSGKGRYLILNPVDVECV